MAVNLPDGARYLPLAGIAPTGGNRPIRDIDSNFWFSPLQPVTPTAPPGTRVRQWSYQPGSNISWEPGAEDTPSVGFWILREMADSWDHLRIIIETVKDRLCERTLEFRLITEPGESKKDLKARTAEDPRIPKLNDFFKYPDGIHSWREWLRMLLEDIFVLDAGAIYLERDIKGRLASLRVIDGATIHRVITAQGFTPQNGDTAYQQILYGLPAIDLKVEDLVYVCRNPRTWKKYGYGPVEQMATIISIGIRKMSYDVKYFTEGNIPEALCFLPPDMEIDAVQEVQQWYDSVLAGNLGKRRRLTFLPGYGSPKEQSFRPNIVFTKENAVTNPLDDWLFRVACYGMGVTPGSMLKEMNKATAQQSAENAEEEGLEPKSRTIEDTITKIVQRVFGFLDIEASFTERRDTDPQIQMEVDTGYLKVGGRTLNEMREDMHEDPYDITEYPEADEPLVFTAQGPVTLRMAINAAKQSMLNAGSSDEGEGEAPSPQEPPPEPVANGSGKPKAKAKKAAGAATAALPSLDPTYETPALRGARANLENALKRVFRRQKERATQAANELLKKKASIIRVQKFNPYHDELGQFSSGDGGSGLASDESTEDKYKQNGVWSPERTKLHDQFMHETLDGKVPAVGRGPIATIMGGGVAVGKSSIRADVIPPNSDPMLADPDAIKAKIPEYAALRKEDPDNAATRVHEESSYVNKRNIAEGIKRKLDINYDGSFSNGTSSNSLITALHKEGYQVNVAYADVPTKIALERARVRAMTSTNPADAGRFVPEEDKMIKGQLIEGAKTRHRMAAENFFRMKDLPAGAPNAPDSLKAYDTSGPFGSKPKLFYEKTGGVEHIYDAVRLEQFRQKGLGNED